MNNLMLSFSGADLTRLRTLVIAVGKEIALIPRAAMTAERPIPGTALDTAWSKLLQMLDLGAEPEMRECPRCMDLCPLGATRCGHCWASLPAVKASGDLTA